MAKSDLKDRLVFHYQCEAIEPHLSVVLAALAITRHLATTTGKSFKKIVQTLRPLRSVIIGIDDHELTAEPTITVYAREILDYLPPVTTRDTSAMEVN